MDGLSDNNATVIVIGATNRIQFLDDAAIRPGRFDRKVHVTKPEFEDRVQLLTHDFQRVKHEQYLDFSYIAEITSGFSGAELANLINEAAIVAVNDCSNYVEMKHVLQAFRFMGYKIKENISSEESLSYIKYLEQLIVSWQVAFNNNFLHN